jgi:hypothetical protein
MVQLAYWKNISRRGWVEFILVKDKKGQYKIN